MWKFFSLFFLYTSILISQEINNQITLSQLFIGINGVQQYEETQHSILACGKVWELYNNSYVISTDNNLYSSFSTSIGNYDSTMLFNLSNFNWKWRGDGSNWGLGLYKISNSKSSNKYFYLDTRDYNYGNCTDNVNPDVYFYYSLSEDKYYSVFKKWFPINNGEIVRVSRILTSNYSTDNLNDYWNNSLVIQTDLNNHPRLIWGKYPFENVSKYNIYKKKDNNYYLCSSITDYEFIDLDEQMISGSYQANEKIVYYKIKAVKSSDLSETLSTNEVSTRIQGEPLSKNIYNDKQYPEKLENFPNPFNPETIIRFNINFPSYVQLKIYDILGKSISTLLDANKDQGVYSVVFNGSNLPAGIYLCALTINGITSINKMILLK